MHVYTLTCSVAAETFPKILVMMMRYFIHYNYYILVYYMYVHYGLVVHVVYIRAHADTCIYLWESVLPCIRLPSTFQQVYIQCTRIYMYSAFSDNSVENFCLLLLLFLLIPVHCVFDTQCIHDSYYCMCILLTLSYFVEQLQVYRGVWRHACTHIALNQYPYGALCAALVYLYNIMVPYRVHTAPSATWHV